MVTAPIVILLQRQTTGDSIKQAARMIIAVGGIVATPGETDDAFHNAVYVSQVLEEPIQTIQVCIDKKWSC